MLKVSWEDILGGFEYAVLENKLSFKKKKAVLHMISLIQYEARQVLRDPFSTKQGDGSGTSY